MTKTTNLSSAREPPRERPVLVGAILAATLLVTLVLWFGRSCWGGWWVADTTHTADTYMLGTIYERWAAQVEHGRLPLWFPDFACGYPVHATWMYGLLYPPLLLFTALPTETAWTWLAILHVVFGALGAYALLWDARRDTAAAAAAGIVFGMSGFLLGRVLCGHLNLVMPFAWTPWVLRAASRTARGERGATFSLALCGGLGMLAGHAQIWFYAAPLAAAWGLFEAISRRTLRSAAPRLVAGAALAVAIAAIQWVPAAELFHVSGHPPEEPKLVEFCSAPPARLFAQVAPRFAEPTREEASGTSPELREEYLRVVFRHEYLGLAGPLAVLAALLALWRSEARRWFWFAVLVLGLVLAMGTRNEVSRLLNQLPPFRFARAPGRGLTLTVLAGSVLAGHLVADWFARSAAAARVAVPAAFLASALVFGIPAPDSVRRDFLDVDWPRRLPPGASAHRVHTKNERYPYPELFGQPTVRNVCPLDTPGYRRLTQGSPPAPAATVAWWCDVAAEVDSPWRGPPADTGGVRELVDATRIRAFDPGSPIRGFAAATVAADDEVFARISRGERSLWLAPGTATDGVPAAAGPVALESAGSAGEIAFTSQAAWTLVPAKWYPGWIEEGGAEVVRGNLAFLAVRRHEDGSAGFRLRYAPWWKMPALLVSAASLAIAAAGLLAQLRRGRASG